VVVHPILGKELTGGWDVAVNLRGERIAVQLESAALQAGIGEKVLGVRLLLLVSLKDAF